MFRETNAIHFRVRTIPAPNFPMSFSLQVNGIPSGWKGDLLAVVGGPIQRRLAQWGRIVQQIADFEPALQAEDNAQIRKRSLSLKYRAKSGEALGRLVPEGYALVREAARRAIGLRRPRLIHPATGGTSERHPWDAGMRWRAGCAAPSR